VPLIGSDTTLPFAATRRTEPRAPPRWLPEAAFCTSLSTEPGAGAEPDVAATASTVWCANEVSPIRKAFCLRAPIYTRVANVVRGSNATTFGRLPSA
jgi:hypothetical protein